MQLFVRLGDLRETIEVFSDYDENACVEVQGSDMMDPGGGQLTIGFDLDNEGNTEVPRVTIYSYIPSATHIPE